MIAAVMFTHLYYDIHRNHLVKSERDKSELRREVEIAVSKNIYKKIEEKKTYDEKIKKKKELQRNSEINDDLLDFYIEEQLNEINKDRNDDKKTNNNNNNNKSKKVLDGSLLTKDIREKYENVLNQYKYLYYRIYEKRLNENIMWDTIYEYGYQSFLKTKLINMRFENTITVMQEFITSDTYYKIKMRKESEKPKFIKRYKHKYRSFANQSESDDGVNEDHFMENELSYIECVLRIQRWIRFYIYLKTGINEYIDKMAKYKERMYNRKVYYLKIVLG